MESFQELTGFQGGSLERSYKRLNGDYKSANDQARKLHDKVDSINQVSKDLFTEWQGEIAQMGNPKLKSQSTAMLRDAKTRQAAYLRAMRKTESQITAREQRHSIRKNALERSIRRVFPACLCYNLWQRVPGRQTEMHHEELIDFNVLTGNSIHQLAYSLRVEERSVVILLKRIAAVEQVNFRKVNHHLPFACLATYRVKFKPIGSRAHHSLPVDNMEDRVAW